MEATAGEMDVLRNGGPAAAPRELLAAAAARRVAGEWHQARELYEQLLEQVTEDDACCPEVLRDLGSVERAAGSAEEAARYYRASHEVAQRHGSVGEMAHAVHGLAVLAAQRGELDEAQRGFETARGLALEVQDQRLLGMIEQQLGMLWHSRGDSEAALRCYEAALPGFRAAADAEMMATVLTGCGTAALELERWDDAGAWFQEAVEIAEGAGLHALLSAVRLSATELAVRRGRWEVVAEVGRCGVTRARRAGSRVEEAAALRLSGLAALNAGDAVAAEKDLSSAALLAAEAQDRLLEARATSELATVYEATGRLAEAGAALATVLTHYQRMGARRAEEEAAERLAALNRRR